MRAAVSGPTCWWRRVRREAPSFPQQVRRGEARLLTRLPSRSSLGYLEDTLKAEQTQGEFSDLPRDYLEVSKVLLET